MHKREQVPIVKQPSKPFSFGKESQCFFAKCSYFTNIMHFLNWREITQYVVLLQIFQTTKIQSLKLQCYIQVSSSTCIFNAIALPYWKVSGKFLLLSIQILVMTSFIYLFISFVINLMCAMEMNWVTMVNQLPNTRLIWSEFRTSKTFCMNFLQFFVSRAIVPLSFAQTSELFFIFT